MFRFHIEFLIRFLGNFLGGPIATAGGLILCSVLIASCAKPPRETKPDLGVEVPDNWTSTIDAPTESGDENWWRTFADERLDELIVTALENNRDLDAAAARVYAAASQATIVGADAMPQIAATGDLSRTQRNFVGFPIPGGGDVLTTRSNFAGAGINMQWELDVWGRIRAGKSAALADMQAARADAMAARLSLIGQTTKLWFQLTESHRQFELTEATLENFRSTHAKIMERYKRGLRPSLDVRFSLTSIAAAEAEVQFQMERRDGLMRQLETLMGRYPGAKIELTNQLPEMPDAIPEGLPAELIARRPDIVSSERRVAASGARVDEARRAFYPRISLTASGGTSSSELKDLVSGDFSVWTLAGNLTQPLFQGGRLIAGLDLAKNIQREALAIYVTTALNAYREVEQTLAAEGYLRDREEALKRATEHSVAARAIAEDRYARGLDGLITVLEAQRRAFNSESAQIMIQRDRLINRVDLYMALGGDYYRWHLSEITENSGGEGTDLR